VPTKQKTRFILLEQHLDSFPSVNFVFVHRFKAIEELDRLESVYRQMDIDEIERSELTLEVHLTDGDEISFNIEPFTSDRY
jgi:hypothetical protein